MTDTKKEIRNRTEKNSKKETYTCVCNMEWRGLHGDEWGDCVCSLDEQSAQK